MFGLWREQADADLPSRKFCQTRGPKWPKRIAANKTPRVRGTTWPSNVAPAFCWKWYAPFFVHQRFSEEVIKEKNLGHFQHSSKFSTSPNRNRQKNNKGKVFNFTALGLWCYFPPPPFFGGNRHEWRGEWSIGEGEVGVHVGISAGSSTAEDAAADAGSR